MNQVIKGDYKGAEVNVTISTEPELYFRIWKDYWYIQRAEVAYCSVVSVEEDINLIGAMIGGALWGHMAGNAGKVAGVLTAPKNYTYVIEFEFTNGKHSLVRVNEKIKKVIADKFPLKRHTGIYDSGYGMTVYDFSGHIESEFDTEQRSRHKSDIFRLLRAWCAALAVFTVIALIFCCLKGDNLKAEKNADLRAEEALAWEYHEYLKNSADELVYLLSDTSGDKAELSERAAEISDYRKVIYDFTNSRENDESNEYYAQLKESNGCYEGVITNAVSYLNGKYAGDTEYLEYMENYFEAAEDMESSVGEQRSVYLKQISAKSKTDNNDKTDEDLKNELIDEEASVWECCKSAGSGFDEIFDLAKNTNVKKEKLYNKAENAYDEIKSAYGYVLGLDVNNENEKYYTYCKEYLRQCLFFAYVVKDSIGEGAIYREDTLEVLNNGLSELDKLSENLNTYRSEYLDMIG